jgi:hypothetical protein
MAIVFVPGQVAVSDPSPIGPTATSNVKELYVKVVKLSSANFAVTTSVKTLVAVLPADATLLQMNYYNKVALTGGGITAATINVGTISGGADLINAYNVFTAAGTLSSLQPAGGLMQPYSVPLGPDIQLWVSGLSTTGTPTAGESYITFIYTR